MGNGRDSAETDYTTFGTLKVEERVPLPDVLDILIAGGGPGGTAAAMRARELGLSALVIDSDELLKEIRDFGEKKPVQPDYGRADVGPFPPGGALLTSL